MVPIIDIVVIRDQLSIKLVNSSYSTLIIQTHIIITWPPCAMAVAYRAWTFTMATLKWPRPIRPISSVRNCRPTGERTNHCRLHSRYAFFTPFDLTMPEIPAVCLSRSVSCLELVFHFFYIETMCVHVVLCRRLKLNKRKLRVKVKTLICVLDCGNGSAIRARWDASDRLCWQWRRVQRWITKQYDHIQEQCGAVQRFAFYWQIGSW